MELRHLRYFVAAAETENISRAAQRLHVSQPALSRQVRDLEEELGFSLFERGPKSLRLTEAGRAFLIEARAILARAEEGVRAARAVFEGHAGELKVGYAPSPTARILPPALRAFQEEWPKVRVKLFDWSTEEMLTGLREGKLHLALLVEPLRSMLRGLHFEAFARDPMRLAVAPFHPFARLASVSPLQAAQEPLVVLSRKEYPEYHDYLDQMFSSTGKQVKIVEEHDSATSLIAAVEAGLGLAVAPESLSCQAGARLKFVRLSPSPPSLVIGGAWSKQGVAPLAQRFLNLARRAANQSGMEAAETVAPKPTPGPKRKTGRR
jgi:DNA-binding transcriptional LysR family regulator